MTDPLLQAFVTMSGDFSLRFASFEMTSLLGGAGRRAGETPRRFACSPPLLTTTQLVISSEARNLPLFPLSFVLLPTGTRRRRNEESLLIKMKTKKDASKEIKKRGLLFINFSSNLSEIVKESGV